MLRLLTISCLVMFAAAQLKEFNLDESFYSNTTDISDLKCNNIEGNLKGCYECYLCNAYKIQEKRSQKKYIYNLAIKDGHCESSELCCIKQEDLSFRDSDNLCGASNQNGDPYSPRPSPRAVLQGEYPWRAWVYSKRDLSRPLCAATYINDNKRRLLVPVNCVRDRRPNSLTVRFSKHSQANFVVKSTAVHSDYDSYTHTNDIALISLDSSTPIPKWVKPACLPVTALQHGSTCVGVSDNDNSINFVLPKQSNCDETDPQLPTSVMCAISAPHDYKHEYGGGLFCLKNDEKKPTYVVYGIALHRSGDVISLYTNITDLTSWIETIY